MFVYILIDENEKYIVRGISNRKKSNYPVITLSTNKTFHFYDDEPKENKYYLYCEISDDRGELFFKSKTTTDTKIITYYTLHETYESAYDDCLDEYSNFHENDFCVICDEEGNKKCLKQFNDAINAYDTYELGDTILCIIHYARIEK